MQFALLISSLINIISLDVTSFNSAVTLKLKCGKVVCVEFFIFRDRSSVAYRATENLSRFSEISCSAKLILLKQMVKMNNKHHSIKSTGSYSTSQHKRYGINTVAK